MNTIFSHRSVRNYTNTPIPETVMTRCLEAATRASNTGNMQIYSIIVTTDSALRQQLAECHFNQPAAVSAPAHVTFCVDVNRFSQWCRQRDADPGYDNLLWFMSGATDANIAAQNFALEAEENGLGICYLGTAIYNADRISCLLGLPHGVIPVAALTVGYASAPVPLTDRLPLEAVVHYDTYKTYTSEQIDALWNDRESSEETLRLLAENKLPNLARIFTERRYTRSDSELFSEKYLDLMRRQGFIK